MLSFISNHIEANTNTAFQNYRLAVQSLQQKNLEEAEQYLDQIVMDDLSYSEYLAKAIYLKSIILTAEVKSNLKIEEYILEGRKKLDLDKKLKRDELQTEAESYALESKRKVDTLLGLVNYLLANLPPVEFDIRKISDIGQPSSDIINQISMGDLPEDSIINSLQRDLTLQNINRYLDLTLGVEEFNNLFVIKAKKHDNLSNIANNYDLPVSLLIEVNSHIDNPNLIYPGQKIYVPRVNNSHINYPSYFYYISTTAYEANKERKPEINRLVTQAYQLTNQKNNVDFDYKSKAKELSKTMEREQYKIQLEKQAEKIDNQNRKLNQLKQKYNTLLDKLEKLKENEKKDNEQQYSEEGIQLNNDSEDSNYNPEEDPLTY